MQKNANFGGRAENGVGVVQNALGLRRKRGLERDIFMSKKARMNNETFTTDA